LASAWNPAKKLYQKGRRIHTEFESSGGAEFAIDIRAGKT